MAIKFICPHCQKPLSVKDDALAGKKVGCPKCRKVVVIPQPAAAAAPAEDVEALAAAALGEARAEASPAAPAQTIDFECPQCGEPIKMSRDLGGKNAPCPECKRIIKVPMPKTKEGADWRKKDDNLPSAARRDTEPAPEGAWESSRAKGVSAQALIEAGLVPKKKRPGLTRRQKIYRGITIGTAVVVAGAVGLFAWKALVQTNQAKLVETALKAADDQPNTTKEPAAAANRAAGEYYLRTGSRESADQAQKHFGKARDLLNPPKSTAGPEADLLLADLAVSQADLGGGDEDVKYGRRLKWAKAFDEIRATLGHVSSATGRLHALRLVSRRLIARGRAADAIQLAGQAAPNKADDDPEAAYESPEALAVVGIELFRAGQKDDARKLGARAAQPYAVPGDNPARPPLSPSAVALALALGQPEPKPGKAKEDDELYAAGRAAGLALKGEPAAARDVPKGPAEARFRVLVLLAEATGEAADVDAAAALLDGEVKAAEPGVPWLVYRLAVVAAKAGQADRVVKLAEHVADPGLKARAQLEAVRARLDGTKDQAGDSALQGIDKGPLLQALAHEWLARHNGKLDYGGTIKAVEGWEEAVRPFGVLGAVLGEQDARGK
jgi:ssDNA-binding Zn-finger/Zn-ribbon topoisomerase 1